MSTTNKDIISYTLKPSQVVEAMELADATRDSLMLWGSPGIGKSDIARQYADTNYPLLKDNLEKLAKLLEKAEDPDHQYTMEEYEEFKDSLIDQDSNFIDFRLSQIEPSDLRGIPIPVKLYLDMEDNRILESELHLYKSYKTETAVVWAAPEVLKLHKNWKGVIIFDEINSAMPIVQAASYQLILDRRVGEMVLPDNALILAAGNRETDGGVTFPLAVPLRDRMTHIEMVPDFQDWIDMYAIPHKLYPGTIAYISNTGSKNFNTLNPQDPSHAAGSSPRSWTKIAHMEPVRIEKNTSAAVYKAMVAGRVGNAIATEYVTFIENMANLPDVMDILSGQITDLTGYNMDISKNYFVSLNLVYKMISLYEQKEDKIISNETFAAYATNFYLFMERVFSKTQSELSIMAIRTMTKANVLISYKDVPAMKPFAEKYSPLVRKVRRMG